jgi:hypothetical protein
LRQKISAAPNNEFAVDLTYITSRIVVFIGYDNE